MSSITDPMPGSRKRKVLFSLVVLALLGSVAATAELYLRLLHRPGPGAARFLFQCKKNLSRWEYLDRERHNLRLESLLRVEPGISYVEEPEANRPPFDKVMVETQVQNNAAGFRERPFPKKKAAGARRVLVLGDSVAWGKGVAMAERFSDLLRAKLPAGAQVYNLAQQGCTTACMVRFLERNVALAPDLVIFQVSGNDIDQTLWREAAVGSLDGWGRTALSLAARSRALLHLFYALRGDPSKQQRRQAEASAGRYYRADFARLFTFCRKQGCQVLLLELPYATGYHYGAHARAACAANRDVCPKRLSVDFSHPGRWLSDWKKPARGAHADDFVERTEKHVGLPAGTLSAVFPFRVFFHDIVHLNARGHRLVALQLAARLKKGAGAPLLHPAGSGGAEDRRAVGQGQGSRTP